MSELPSSPARWLWTKYVRAPLVRMQRDRFLKKSNKKTKPNVAPQRKGSLHFSFLDLPTELRLAIFEHVIESWSLSMSSHDDACLGDFLCSIDYGFVNPGSFKKIILKSSKDLRSMLNLLSICKVLYPVVLDLIDKRYTGHAKWSSCGVYYDSGTAAWHVPKVIRTLIMRKTWRIAILGLVPPCAVRRLFPWARITYHVPITPFTSRSEPTAVTSILSGNLDDLMERLSHGLLVSRWQRWSSCNCLDDTQYMVQFHSNILPTPDTEVLARLRPLSTGLIVVSKWVATRDTIMSFWMDASSTEIVQSVVRRRKERMGPGWITALTFRR